MYEKPDGKMSNWKTKGKDHLVLFDDILLSYRVLPL